MREQGQKAIHGRVGIRTTSPAQALHVNGSLNVSGTIYGSFPPIKSYTVTLGNVVNTVTPTDTWNFTVPKER